MSAVPVEDDGGRIFQEYDEYVSGLQSPARPVARMKDFVRTNKNFLLNVVNERKEMEKHTTQLDLIEGQTRLVVSISNEIVNAIENIKVQRGLADGDDFYEIADRALCNDAYNGGCLDVQCTLMINTFCEKFKKVTKDVNCYLKHSSVETWLKDGLTVGKQLDVPNCFVPDPDHMVTVSGVKTLAPTATASGWSRLMATKIANILDSPSKSEFKFVLDLGPLMDNMTLSMQNLATEIDSNLILKMPKVAKTLRTAVEIFKQSTYPSVEDLSSAVFDTVEKPIHVRSMTAHIKEASFRKFVPKIRNEKLFAESGAPQISGLALENIKSVNGAPVFARMQALTAAVTLFSSEVASTVERAATTVDGFRTALKNKHVLVESKEWAEIGKGYSDCFQHFVELNKKAVHIDDLVPLYALANSSLEKYVKDFREIDAAVQKVKDAPYKGPAVGTSDLKNLFEVYDSTIKTLKASWNTQVANFKINENNLRSLKEKTENDLRVARDSVSQNLQELASLTNTTEQQRKDKAAQHDQYTLSISTKSAALETLKVEMRDLQSKYHDQSISKNNVDVRLSSAEIALGLAQGSENQLRDKNNTLAQEKQQVELKIKQLNFEITSLEAQLASAATHTQPANTSELNALKTKVQNLLTKVTTLEQAKTNLQSEKDLLDEEVKVLNKEIAKLRKDQLAASTSQNLGPGGPPPPPPPPRGGSGGGSGGAAGFVGVASENRDEDVGTDSSASLSAPCDGQSRTPSANLNLIRLAPSPDFFSAEAELLDLRNKNKSRQEKNERYKKKTEDAREKFKGERRLHAETKNNYQSLLEDHTEIKKTLKIYEEKSRKLDEENKEAAGEIERLTDEKSKVEQKLASLKKAERQRKQMYEDLNDAHKRLKCGKASPDQAAQNQIDEHEEKAKSLEKELTDLNQKASSAKAELKAKNKKLGALEQEVEGLRQNTTALHAAEQDLEKLKAELKKQTNQAKRTQEDYQTKYSELEAARDKCKSRKEENRTLKNQQLLAEQDLEEARAAKKESDEANKKMAQDLQDLRSEFQSKEKEHDTELEFARETVRRLRQTLENAGVEEKERPEDYEIDVYTGEPPQPSSYAAQIKLSEERDTLLDRTTKALRCVVVKLEALTELFRHEHSTNETFKAAVADIRDGYAAECKRVSAHLRRHAFEQAAQALRNHGDVAQCLRFLEYNISEDREALLSEEELELYRDVDFLSVERQLLRLGPDDVRDALCSCESLIDMRNALGKFFRDKEEASESYSKIYNTVTDIVSSIDAHDYAEIEPVEVTRARSASVTLGNGSKELFTQMQSALQKDAVDVTTYTRLVNRIRRAYERCTRGLSEELRNCVSGSVEQLSYVLRSKMQNELGVFAHSDLEPGTWMRLPEGPYKHSVSLYAVVQNSPGDGLYEKFSAFLADKAQCHLADYIKTFMSRFEQGVELTQALLFVGAMLIHYESNAPQTSLPIAGHKTGAKRSRPMSEDEVLIPIPKRSEEGVKPTAVQTMVAHRNRVLAFKKRELALWTCNATSPQGVYDEYNEYMCESVLWHQDVNPNKHLACWQEASVSSLAKETVDKIKTMSTDLEFERMRGCLSCDVTRWNAARVKVSDMLSFLKTHDLSRSICYVSLVVDHLAYVIPPQPKDSELSAWHALICVQACVTQADTVHRDILKLDQAVTDAVYTEACYREASQGLINGFIYMPAHAALFVSTKSYLSVPKRLSVFKIDERLLTMICNFLTSSGGFHYAAGTTEDATVTRTKAANRQALLSMYVAHNTSHGARVNDTIHTKNNIITGETTIKTCDRDSFNNFIYELGGLNPEPQSSGEETHEGGNPDDEVSHTVQLLNHLGLSGFPLALCFGPAALETFLFLSLRRGEGENYDCPGSLWWFSATCVDFVMFCVRGKEGRYTVVAARAACVYVMCEEETNVKDWRARTQVFLGWDLPDVRFIKCKHPWAQALALYLTDDVAVFSKPIGYPAKCKAILSGTADLPHKNNALTLPGCILLTETEKRPRPAESAADEEEDIADPPPNRSLLLGGLELASASETRARPVVQKMEVEAEDEASRDTQEGESEEELEEHDVVALDVRSEEEAPDACESEGASDSASSVVSFISQYEVQAHDVRPEIDAPDADDSSSDGSAVSALPEYQVEALAHPSEMEFPDACEREEDSSSGSSVASCAETQALGPALQAGGMPAQITYVALNSRDPLSAEASKPRALGRAGRRYGSSSSENDSEGERCRKMRRPIRKPRKSRTGDEEYGDRGKARTRSPIGGRSVSRSPSPPTSRR